MHLILLSGGSGKRLWPLSNDARSKQFLKVLPSPIHENSGSIALESMVQRVYRQISTSGEWDSITVAAGAVQTDILKLQLGPDVGLVIEPERRDTFPAIVLACAYLSSELKVGKDEVIAVLPVDPFVEDGYFQTIKRFEEHLRREGGGITLMGAKPTFPSTKYGYILPREKETAPFMKVDGFREKPDQATAEQYIAKGALWNCGVFGFKLSFILDILRDRYGIDNVDYNKIRNGYSQFKKISFDYEVLENASDISVISYEGNWKDLGTWETLTEEMGTKLSGNVTADSNCTNTHIINELSIPVVAMNISNAVIVSSRDGILVAEKGKTPGLKELLSDMSTRPMYEEKRWGEYEVIDHIEYEDNGEVLTKKLRIHEGMQLSYQLHHHRKEVWTIISGKGLLYLNGEKRNVKMGDVVQIDEGQKHGIKALSELEVIEVQMGDPLIEEDIERFLMEWD